MIWALALAMPGARALAADETVGFYFDGGQRRNITLQTGWVAEFSTRQRAGNRVMANNAATAGERAGGTPIGSSVPYAPYAPTEPTEPTEPTTASVPYVQLRRVAAAASSSPPPAENTSPVFREGDSAAGRLMALPGGVIVNFKLEWTAAQIRSWLQSQGLTIRHAMALQGHWFVIDSAAGLASLQLANAIQASGQVLSASPNWWKQTPPR